jgi:hypothetical protein
VPDLPSLLDRDAAQPDLPALAPEVAADVEAHEATTGRYTAERLHEREPRLYMAAISLLARGHSDRETAEILRVHHRTIAAVRERERASAAMDARKQQLAGEFERLASIAARTARDRIEDAPGSVSVRDLGVVAGIAADKAQLLAGEPTARIEVERVASPHADFILAAAEMGFRAGWAANASRAGEAVEVGAGGGGAVGGAVPGGPAGDLQVADRDVDDVGGADAQADV